MKMKKGLLIPGILITVFGTLIGAKAMILFSFLGTEYLSIEEEQRVIIMFVGVSLVSVIPFVGVIMMVAAALIPLFSRMSANSKIRTEGQQAQAQILALNDTRTRVNNDPLVKFYLEVRPLAQPAFKAEATHTISYVHLPSYQPGKIVNVKFIPGSNEAVILFPEHGD